jgi:HEAT repeat protein
VTLDELLAALASENPETRIDAIQTIETQTHTEAVGPLIDMLHDDADMGVRYTAAHALAVFADPAATDALLVALRTHDMWLRVAVTDALIRIGEPAVDGLVIALRDENHAVRRAAAKALGKIGDERATTGLNASLLDVDTNVRRFAAEALGRIGDEKLVGVLGEALRDDERPVREAAARALYDIGEPAIPVLLAALEDPNPDVSMAAIFTLKNMNYEPPTP